MKYEDILTALEEISDKHILEAENPPKKKFFIKAAAAAAVIMIGINILNGPALIMANVVAEASEPRIVESPDVKDYDDIHEWSDAFDVWQAEMDAKSEMVIEAMSGLQTFFREGNSQFLQTEGNENRIWSPVNAYIGLAMMTEITGQETQQQVLDVLGVKDTDELRKKVSAVWESVYHDNSKEISVLSNSLWLEKGVQYNQEAMDALAYHYYASVYQTDLGSNQANRDISAWINNNTGKFLEDSAKNIALEPDTILALYSTLYFQSKWVDEFNNYTSEHTFYMPEGETQAVYMSEELGHMNYYWGDNFSAVNKSLKNGSRMWFILPDEGMTIDDVLNNGTYMEMLLSNEWEDYKRMKVNLMVPMFDISSTMDLSDGLKNMGMTDVFNQELGVYTKLTSDTPIWFTGVNQSVRVEIDTEGVKAASYIEIAGAGSAALPDEIIDFVLNRPFIFVITKDNVPLFAGCVNDPTAN